MLEEPPTGLCGERRNAGLRQGDGFKLDVTSCGLASWPRMPPHPASRLGALRGHALEPMDELISMKDHQTPRLPPAFSDPFI